MKLVSTYLKGNLIDYEYDSDNRIVEVKADSECAEYEHRASKDAIQNDIMGDPTRLNSVIARDTEDRENRVELQWYHKNYLDHVYAVSDDNGNLIEHYRYTAFGEPEIYSATGAKRNTSAIGNTVMWNSRRYDADNGLYYYKYRHYAANIGRWLGRDPIEEEGGYNLHAFVGNEPIGRWDIFGLSQKRNCRSLSKEFAPDIRSGSLGTKVGFGVSVTGSVSLDFSLGGETCEECCSDGTWKEVTRGVWSVNLKGAVSIRGGLHADFTWGGHGVNGFLGASGSLSASGGGQVNITNDGCSGQKNGSGSITFSVGGSITGGGNLTLQAGWFTFDIARVEITGSATRSYGVEVKCDENSCSLGAVTPNGQWNTSLSAKGCAFGTCYTHQF